MIRIAKVLVGVILAMAVVACGASSGHRPATALADRVAPPSASLVGGCPRIATSELADVARRIYTQSINGRGVTTAVRRLHRITALATALETGDRAAVRRVFLPIRHQIVRIELFRGKRLVYSYGHAPTFAPIRGSLRDAQGHRAGRFVLAVTDQAAYAGLVTRLTGAAVTFTHQQARAGLSTVAGGTVLRLASHAYPGSGPLQVGVRIPTPPRSLCGTDPADTRLNTIAYVGRRLLQAEAGSHGVRLTLRHVANDPAFRAATAANDPIAIRHAIIFDFFRDHSFHVVRVRVTRGTKLIYDLGGPYALQPASGTVRSPDGRTSATFSLAVQDDTGYIKLMHRFTGAAIQLVSPLGKVPGSTLEPGPAQIPDHGSVTWKGRRYLAESINGTAFPSGLLRVSLLVPA